MTGQPKPFQIIARWGVWIAVAGILGASDCLAAEVGKTAGTIRKITPMRSIGTHRANDQAEGDFDIIGILNQLESDRIVVGNNEMKPVSGLRTGDVKLSNMVGVKLNSSGKVVKIEVIYNDPH